MPHQPGILEPPPSQCRYLWFRRRPDGDAATALRELASRVEATDVIGIGKSVVRELGQEIPGLRDQPVLTGPGIVVPSTPRALWIWLRGDDRGALLHRGRELARLLAPAFEIAEVVEGFEHGGGRDLSGYEDGTENPTGDRATEVGLAPDGSSLVAVQRWRHDLDALEAMSQQERDHTIGRRRSDNEELAEAPASAHVKRTAQESFEPEAFILRRSMPWAGPGGEGLVFVAFGRSFDAFEALLGRMVGREDGITDALFRFTRPETGAYFWCPPVGTAGLDLSLLGL